VHENNNKTLGAVVLKLLIVSLGTFKVSITSVAPFRNALGLSVVNKRGANKLSCTKDKHLNMVFALFTVIENGMIS